MSNSLRETYWTLFIRKDNILFENVYNLDCHLIIQIEEILRYIYNIRKKAETRNEVANEKQVIAQ